MNLHLPQDIESASELRNLAAIPYQIISPANNSSIIGIFQDSLLGSYRFTRDKINFDIRDAMNLLMRCKQIDVTKINKNKMTNFEILSQILPPLSIQYKTKGFKDTEDPKTSNHILEIVNGEYIRGQIDKGVLGAGSKGLIQRICNDFGNMDSANFIDDLQNIITEYMKSSAYSVGISDLIADAKTNEEITKIITEKKQKVQSYIDQTHLGIFENKTGKTNEQEFETQVNEALNEASKIAGKIGRESLNKDNRFVIMVNAGSKGSDINISQMISCLGQQNVDGKRIPYGFEDRTLPHYTKYDDSPNARGFVENSFISGLSPQELFFHAMGGRVGLIDTAVKTSTTGYIQRRLIKGLEDIKVEYDMTVRNNKQKIIQFSYGDDGFDTVKVESQVLPLLEMTYEDIYSYYHIPDSKLKNELYNTLYTKSTLKRMKEQEKALLEKCDEMIQYMIEKRKEIANNVFENKLNKTINIPVAFQHIINNVQGQYNITNNSMIDITLLEAFEIIERGFDKISSIHYIKPTELFKIAYFYYLSPKELTIKKRFNKTVLHILIEKIVLAYKQAIVAPGEMVGMIAAQSIGEPTTQMTLNSFVYETPIIVRKNKTDMKIIQMGEFVEKCIQNGKEGKTNMEYYKDKDTTYAPTLKDELWEIQAPDEDGNINWYKIEAGTQHPVINEDGTNTMLKVTTENAEEVIATKAKSFLRLENSKLVPLKGDQLKVGDYIPVSTKNIQHTSNYIFEVKDVLLKQENSLIPDIIKLDYDFGYLIGAYCATGYSMKTQITITNYDINYYVPILRWCKDYNINSEQIDNIINIYNITELLEKVCGKLSHGKFIHEKLIFSNDDFKTGFINGYIGGDGSLSYRSKHIVVSSVSYQLLEDFNVMLKTLDIYSYIRKNTKQTSNNRGTKEENIRQSFVLYVRNSSMVKMAKYLVNNEIKHKADIAKQLVTYKPKTKYNKYDEYIPNIIDGEVVMQPRNNTMKDVVFVKVKSIEEVPNTTNYAYDLTVETTRNFITKNGLNLRDTFHWAGVASKSNVTRGVPRIEEILSLSENPKNPSCTIQLLPTEKYNQENAQKIMYQLEHTRLREVVKEIDICFDPDDDDSLIEMDRTLIQQFKAFEEMMDECTGTDTQTDEEQSKWIIRIVMDEEELLERNITMDDIHYTVKNAYGDDIQCIFSDYNDDKLIFRIRFNNLFKKKKAMKKYDPLDQQDEIYLLKNIQDQLLDNLILRGIKGIDKVILRKVADSIVEEDTKYVRKDTWVLDTVGTNLLDLLSLDYIDVYNTTTNDIQEIYRVFGIEAARQAIFNEFIDVIEFDGTYINYHHLSVLCDRMTCSDKMISIFRHGINNDDIGPIAKASFEETPEMFIKTARHGELDHMRGVSANVMCGQEGYFGTSAFQVVLNLNEINKLKEKEIKETKTSMEMIEETFDGLKITDDVCSIEHLSIPNNVNNIKSKDLGEDDDYKIDF